MTIRFECLYEFVGPEGPLPNGIDITERHTSELLKLSNYTWHGGPNSLFTLHSIVNSDIKKIDFFIV